MALLTAARIGLLAAALASPALAHVVADPTQAIAGTYQAVRFRVGHGCDGRATTAIRVEIPAAVEAARPQPKPGWRLAIAAQGEKVTAVTWTGALPEGQFDEFAILFRLPAAAQTLAFPIAQSCGATVVRWDQPDPPGGPRPERPVPTLTLTAPATAAEEHHH